MKTDSHKLSQTHRETLKTVKRLFLLLKAARTDCLHTGTGSEVQRDVTPRIDHCCCSHLLLVLTYLTRFQNHYWQDFTRTKTAFLLTTMNSSSSSSRVQGQDKNPAGFLLPPPPPPPLSQPFRLAFPLSHHLLFPGCAVWLGVLIESVTGPEARLGSIHTRDCMHGHCG